MAGDVHPVPPDQGLYMHIPDHLGLHVGWVPGKGKAIFTTQPFRAGQLVLAQQPYAAALDSSETTLRCDCCWKTGQDLMKCGRSQFARFCSRAHQKASWESGYKEECAAIVAMGHTKLISAKTVRLAARAQWKAIREQQASTGDAVEWSSWPAPGGRWAHVAALWHHWDAASSSTKLLQAQLGLASRLCVQESMKSSTLRKAAAAALKPTSIPDSVSVPAQQQQPVPNDRPDAPTDGCDDAQPINSDSAASAAAQSVEEGVLSPRESALLIARIICNSHTVCDEEERPIGTGLYPLACLANHSCNPTCSQSFDGNVIVFRALRDLAPGEEVTIAYVEIGNTRQLRREQLWDSYCFDSDADPAVPAVKAGTPAMEALRTTPLLSGRFNLLDPDLKRMLPGCQLPPSKTDVCFAVYATTAQPPWPSDPADEQLCAIETLEGLQGTGSPAGGTPHALPGGVQLQWVMPDDGDDHSMIFGDLAQLTGEEANPKPADSKGHWHVQLWGPWTQDEAFVCSLAAFAASLAVQDSVCTSHCGQGRFREGLAVVQAALNVCDRMQVRCAAPGGSLVSKVIRLGPYHMTRKALLATQLKAAIDSGQAWDVAMSAAQKLTPIYERIYPRVWPTLGLHYATVTKLAFFLEDWPLTVSMASKALDVFKITHANSWGGRGADLCNDIARMRWEAQQQMDGTMA